MSGTAYGTVVLHMAPEAAVGGPLALVRNGDMIELDVPNAAPASRRRRRRARATRMQPGRRPRRRCRGGYWKLYVDHVLQADQGADLDFLVGKRGAFVPRDNH